MLLVFLAIDCHTPDTPHNGLIHFQATTLNEKVVHSCKAGYLLIGASFRACQANGLWSGSSPLCVRKLNCMLVCVVCVCVCVCVCVRACVCVHSLNHMKIEDLSVNILNLSKYFLLI